jgi:hypothetical protein
MPKVAIFTTINTWDSYGDDSLTTLTGAAGEWTEVSDEDYKYLYQHSNRLLQDGQVFVVQYKDVEVKKLVTDIKKLIHKDKEDIAKRKQEAEAKALAAKMKKIAKKEQTEKELFEALKQKFEATNGNH